jgi:hypothetical protein
VSLPTHYAPTSHAGGDQVGRVGVSIVVPCYNESDNIQQAYQAILDALGDYDIELVFVDDGSTDDTLVTIQRLADVDSRVHYLSFSRNYGFEAAFSAGFRYSEKPWILQLDADMQFPASEAPKLLCRALEGYDAVYGVRLHRHDSLVRVWASRAYHALGSRVLGIRIPPGATTFRVIRTSVAQRIVEMRLATPYFMATIPLLTSRYTTVPVSHRARVHGKSKFRLRGLASHALDLYFGFSTRLRGVALFGLTLAAACGAVEAVLDVTGVLTGRWLVGVTFLVASCALGAIAVLGRYTAMMFAAVQRGPLYCVREANVVVSAEDLLTPVTVPATHGEPS